MTTTDTRQEAHLPRPVRRVLVVDDDEAVREVAKMALEVIGSWQVSTAGSAGEAVRVARTERPDAVLLDVMMPGVDGPGTVALLRDDPVTSELPVIFLTAKAGSGDSGSWAELGLAGVIAKPFDPLTLSAEIARLLGWDR